LKQWRGASPTAYEEAVLVANAMEMVLTLPLTPSPQYLQVIDRRLRIKYRLFWQIAFGNFTQPYILSLPMSACKFLRQLLRTLFWFWPANHSGSTDFL
jgi:hypothetical protein